MPYLIISRHALNVGTDELEKVYTPVMVILERYLDPIQEDYNGIDGKTIEEIEAIVRDARKFASGLVPIVSRVVSDYNTINNTYRWYDEDGLLAKFVTLRFTYLQRRLGYPEHRRRLNPAKWPREIRYLYMLYKHRMSTYFWRRSQKRTRS